MKKQKTNSMKVSVEIPDDKIMSHITNAYGLVSQYRAVNKVPHEQMEKWLTRLIVEGCNAIFNYHNQQLQAQTKQPEKDLAEAKVLKEELKDLPVD